MSEDFTSAGAERSALRAVGWRMWESISSLRGVHALAEHEGSRLLVAGVAVGTLGGAAAAVFDRVLGLVGLFVLQTAEPSTDGPLWWRALAGPAVTGLVAGGLLAWGTVRRRPQGVPDVLERARLDATSLRTRDGVVSAVAAAMVVGGGQSGGREGPIVQLASTLATEACRWFGLPPRHFRALVAAGAAAGVAASFNTPVGGAFFALEIILGDFGVESFAPVVASTVTGTVLGQALLGDRIALRLPAFELTSPLELPIYLLLGVVCGVVAVGLKRAVLAAGARADAANLSLPVRCATAGGGVGLAAVFVPEIMGNGYTWMELAITEPEALTATFLVLLLATKIGATVVTVAGRGGAGMFAPSLYVGAVTGLLVGKLALAAAPGHVGSPGAYGMVGMGAVASGVLHAPITLTLMLFEMTGNYAVILPLLVALASAGVVSRWLGAESLYEAELRRRGVTLERRPPTSLVDSLRVGDVMRDERATLRKDEPLKDAVRRLSSDGASVGFVTDGSGHLEGAVRLGAATACLLQRDVAFVAEALDPALPRLRPEDPLATAVPLFFRSQCDVLGVVDPDGRLVGALHERDVVATYHRVVQEKDTLLARFASPSSGPGQTDFVEIPEGYTLAVVEVDARLAGRTLRELSLPETTGCLVVAHTVWDAGEGRWHRRHPDAGRRLARGDRLVVIGPSPNVTGLQARS